MFQFDIYTFTVLLSSVCVFVLGICLGVVSIPKDNELKNYRISRRFLAAAYILLASAGHLEIFIGIGDNGRSSLLAITVIAASYQSLLFTFAIITLINMRYMTLKRVLGNLIPITILSGILLAVLTVVSEEVFYSVFYIAIGFYCMQLIAYIRCFVNQSSWKNILEEAAKPIPSDPALSESDTVNEGRLVDIDAAIELLGRKKLTIYKLTSQNKIPFIRKGNKLYFEIEKLEQWKADNSHRRRKSSSDESVKNDSLEGQEYVDIYGASKILDRTPGAIRQHLSGLPHHKSGNKLYFDPKELEAWAKTHPPRKRKSKSNETETA